MCLVSLQPFYTNPTCPQLKTFVAKLCGLAFLDPETEVAGGFEQLRASKDCAELLADRKYGDSFNELLSYFEREWMTKPLPWNVFIAVDHDKRTNNEVEGFHRRFHELVLAKPSKHSPSQFGLFLDSLPKVFAENDDKVAAICKGAVTHKCSEALRQKNDALKSMASFHLDQPSEFPISMYLDQLSEITNLLPSV